MAKTLGAQERLDEIVSHIASSMTAEVCSVYALRSDNVLELFATEGLNSSAVHEAILNVGQGLVGTIAATAKTLNLENAKNHPAFAFIPETGEEKYKSFLGVPILRSGRAIGVLVVQNMVERLYHEVEIEALETTAMVLAELIAAGQLEGLDKKGTGLDLTRAIKLSGSSLADGIGIGQVVLHQPRVVVTNLFNEDEVYEKQRLDEALGNIRISIDDMLGHDNVAREGEHRDVLEAYRMFANDRGWVRRMKDAIVNGLTAEAAVEKVQSDNRARMMRQSDPYMRERLHDFDDLAYRLLRELVGKDGESDKEPPANCIVVARNMGAAELLDYNGPSLRGLILEEGSPSSHVVIVARALGIPVIGQTVEAVSLAESGNRIIVDGQEGVIYIRPTDDTLTSYREKVALLEKRQEVYAKLRDEPAVSKDGQTVELLMNAGLLMDLPNIEITGADGIGLFRTELQFMVASRFPRPGEQETLYRDVLDGAGDKPVTFRTLDIGGDKVLPYLRSEQEENPALGWRAVRLSLDRPGLIKSQVRALLRAAGNRDLRLMIPMVTETREIYKVREIIDGEIELLKKFDHAIPNTLNLGTMIEVPALLFQLDELMEAVDFVSVGSNDLFQFMAASDRGNARIARRFDPLSRSFLRVLHKIIVAGKEYNTPVTLCGELASRPISALALFGLGYRSVSMTSAAIGPVKATLLETNISVLEKKLLAEIAKPAGGQTIREFLIDFADANAIPY
ncbi:MAG: phosphoenolpyruvate--protein phosphotransferase [Hyphomicrobiales bacterium]|nr:phosphoenolpyruvate--protein phosphotransferase [Hyphomicrobiales bacterium]PCH49736.1 MAG: phosphoenolpyruvate--protein phosphotransferase [Hyphomicrobiales bacterium]